MEEDDDIIDLTSFAAPKKPVLTSAPSLDLKRKHEPIEVTPDKKPRATVFMIEDDDEPVGTPVATLHTTPQRQLSSLDAMCTTAICSDAEEDSFDLPMLASFDSSTSPGAEGKGKGRAVEEAIEELTPEELRALERASAAPDLRGMQQGIHTLNRITSGQELEDTPKDFNGTLLKHQRIGLSWMLKREEGPDPQGGILADDQGLGKTIQAIALMLRNPPKPERPGTREAMRTLIVTPVSLLAQWRKEIQKFSKIPLRVEMYHGQEKNKDPYYLVEADVILTSYQTLVAETPRENDKGIQIDRGGPLFQVMWYRIILDEATNIKSRLTQTSKSVCKLVASHRWCLSGTPIQNSLQDLYSFLRFIKFRPYDDFSRFQSDFGLRGSVGIQRLRAVLSTVCLRRTKADTLDGQPLLSLPACTVNLTQQVFGDEENIYYRALEGFYQNKFRRYIRDGLLQTHYASALTMLLRLRQACDHPLLAYFREEGKTRQLLHALRMGVRMADMDDMALPEFVTGAAEAAGAGVGADATMDTCSLPDEIKERLLKEKPEMECSICLEVSLRSEAVITHCGHIFCRECLKGVVNEKVFPDDMKGSCPNCRKIILKSQLVPATVLPSDEEDDAAQLEKEEEEARLAQELEDRREEAKLTKVLLESASAFRDKFPTSTKTKVVIKTINDRLEEDSNTKFLVFSQWTTMLDILEEPFSDAGIEYCRYDGSMSAPERAEVLERFKEDVDVKVMLCSLKCAAFGLNLVQANHVIIVDPWWNPSVEAQAIDRCHRIGQQKDVLVTRVVIKGTVEERILDLQNKKRALVTAAFGKGNEAIAGANRLSVRDLMHLFNVNVASVPAQQAYGETTTLAQYLGMAAAAAAAAAPSTTTTTTTTTTTMHAAAPAAPVVQAAAAPAAAPAAPPVSVATVVAAAKAAKKVAAKQKKQPKQKTPAPTPATQAAAAAARQSLAAAIQEAQRTQEANMARLRALQRDLLNEQLNAIRAAAAPAPAAAAAGSATPAAAPVPAAPAAPAAPVATTLAAAPATTPAPAPATQAPAAVAAKGKGKAPAKGKGKNAATAAAAAPITTAGPATTTATTTSAPARSTSADAAAVMAAPAMPAAYPSRPVTRSRSGPAAAAQKPQQPECIIS